MTGQAATETVLADLLDTNDEVLDATSAKVRKFLYELTEGTSDYRSLHNLTEQVEHQYHGRFIVELIQNAHDQLHAPGTKKDQSARIEITLRDEGPFGTLYVANDGRPFSRSNFSSLSQLGNSDKDPQESIGNKGIGFRSVLEITDAPEIYSRGKAQSAEFDGFCFAFSPEVIGRLRAPILDLLGGADHAVSSFGNASLVDWDSRLLAKFRASVKRQATTAQLTIEEWISREMTYLSPYLLPFPLLRHDRSPFVEEFESRGFATLIRFPLKSAATRGLVREKLDELDDSALLFLERASSLVLDTGEHRRDLSRRQVARLHSAYGGDEVSIAELGVDSVRRYLTWKRELPMANAPAAVQAAVHELPGKWPQLREATVSIGVPASSDVEPGVLSIFLPTMLESGCAAHVSAPFFGDMSRTHIDFGDGGEKGASRGAVYNRYLLAEVARLAVSVIEGDLAGTDLEGARAIVDLLAPCGSDERAVARWQQLTSLAAEAQATNTPTRPWVLSDRGWTTLSTTSLLPAEDSSSVLTPTILRKHAKFAAYVEGLSSRRELIEQLSKAHGIGAYPSQDDLAGTVESIALELHQQSEADWNGFWADADSLFEGDCSPLVGKHVLLGNDGQLHASGETCAVFFIPRQGASEDEEVENDGDVKEIPLTLQPFVAFLSDRIEAYEERNGRLQQTRVRKVLLDSRLVSRFRREDIVNNVLLAKAPELPIPASSPESDLCRDILLWGLRLMAHLVDRGKGEKSLRLLQRLPAPCHGGWFPLSEAAFGPGWPGTQGSVIHAYLTRVGTSEVRGARDRLLLPPNHERWNGIGGAHLDLLRRAGVFDGLRLTVVDPKLWPSGFTANKAFFQLPESAPPALSKKDWAEYRISAGKEARPSYNGGTYEVQTLYALPGLSTYSDFDEEARLALMEVVLGSAAAWLEDWASLPINRVLGNWDSFSVQSPLAWLLRRLPWLGLRDGEEMHWCRPADRWHVPAMELARGRRWQFAHLRPLPGELANRLDTQPRLSMVMRQLGLPRFDPESKSESTSLLDALAAAVERNDVPHRDVFLGQVRSAWRGFEASASTAFPNKILVQRGGSQLAAERPDKDHPVYLPDSTKSFLAALRHFELPVIAIEPDDAKRLADRFTAAYPAAVLRASALQPVPLVNGERWTGSSSDRLRDNTELEWVIPVLLTITAFHGPQAQGTATKAFRKHIETFRAARVCIVRSIETGLSRGDTLVAPPLPVAGLWQGDAQTLLLSELSKTTMASLSEAFAGMLDREDLEVPVKLALGLAGWQPTQADVVRALEQLKLTEAHYRDVREHWRGDVSQLIERLIPLLTILWPAADIGSLVELDTDDAVIEFLDRHVDDTCDGKNLVQMARDSADMFDFGCMAFGRFGDAVQLSEWNAALALRGEPLLENTEAADVFRAHLASALPMLRSLAAAAVSVRPEIGTFRELSTQLDGLVCPDNFKATHWEVTFLQTMMEVVPLVEEWLPAPIEIAVLKKATTAEELKTGLTEAGIDTEFDPVQTARDNREDLRNALLQFQKIGLAWALEGHHPNPSDWDSRVDRYLEELSQAIESAAFTRVWGKADVWTLIQRLPVDVPSESFWSEVASATGLDDLVLRLSLSDEALDNASSKLEALRDDARRRNRVIKVCGTEFDNSEENLATLWSHICAALPSEQLSAVASVDLKLPTSLDDLAKRAKRPKKPKEPGKKTSPKRLSKAMEHLIGLSGEIHAFRMLQIRYGGSVVSPACWISSYSAVVGLNDLDSTDNDRGCDFVIVMADRTFCIEVKSSEGDQETFTLGSSEIRLAMALAKKSKKRHKETFLVLRVLNALEATPTFQLLPNPYDPKYQSLYVIEEADARVRYQT